MKDDIWQQQCNQGVNDTASAVLSRNKSNKNYFCWIKDFEQINITDSSRLGKLFLETRNLMIIRVWLHSGTSIAAAAAGRAQTCRVSKILSPKVICCTLESYGMNFREPVRKKIRGFLGVFPIRGGGGLTKSQNFCYPNHSPKKPLKTP